MKSNFVSRTIGVLAFLLVVVYFGSSVVGYFMDPLTTTVAYRYRGEEGFTVTGYLVREETVLSSAQGDMLYLPREEGERVSKGGQVAVVYHSAQALEAARQVEQLEEQLEQLEYAASALSGTQVVVKLDETIADQIYTLRQQVTREELGDACAQADDLRTLVVRRDYAHSAAGAAQLESQAQDLRQQINTLTAAANSGRSFLTADQTGYFSALVDGYEQVLTPDMLEGLTPSALSAVKADSSLSSNVGKLITSDTWYFAANVRPSEAAELKVGSTVTLRFAGLDRDLEMTVQSLSQEENGQVALVLCSDEYLSLTTLLRQQTAQLICRSYEGIRVPKNAVRVLEKTVEQEDGTEETVRYTGVYCRLGLLARLKPVTVLYEGEDYYLVEADLTQMTGYTEDQQVARTIRGGDEVIITAKELYDGKVVG